MLPWIVVLAVFGFLFWMIARENAQKQSRSAEEFERDLAESRGSFMRAGALGLEKMLNPGQQSAIEYVQDENNGLTKAGGRGDGDHPGKE